MRKGEVVQTVRRINQHPHTIHRGTLAKVLSSDGDWLTAETANGGRFEAQLSDVVRILRKDVVG